MSPHSSNQPTNQPYVAPGIERRTAVDQALIGGKGSDIPPGPRTPA